MWDIARQGRRSYGGQDALDTAAVALGVHGVEQICHLFPYALGYEAFFCACRIAWLACSASVSMSVSGNPVRRHCV